MLLKASVNGLKANIKYYTNVKQIYTYIRYIYMNKYAYMVRDSRAGTASNLSICLETAHSVNSILPCGYRIMNLMFKVGPST